MDRNFGFVVLALLFLVLILYQFSQLKLWAVTSAAILILGLCAYDLVLALGILIFAVALSPEIQLLGIPIRVEDLIIPFILLVWVFQAGVRRTRLKPTNLRFPILAFLFFMLVATLNAIILNPSIDRVKATFHFLKQVEYVIFFLLTLNVVEDEDDVRFLSYCLIGAALTLALQSVYSPYALLGAAVTQPGTAVQGAEDIQRLRGVITETANIFGGFLVFHMLFTLGYLIEDNSLQRKLIFGAVFCVMAYPLFFTLSRSSYVGLVAGVILLGLFRDPKILLGALLVAGAITFILPTNVIERFLTIFDVFTGAGFLPSWQARLQAWQKYLPVIVRNPFIGKGLFYITPGDVDNELVLRGVETGILGVISFLWLFLSLFARALPLWNRDEPTIFRQLGVGYCAGLTGLFFHSLAATSFTAIRTAEPLYLTSGLVVASYLLSLNISPQHTYTDIRRRESSRRRKSSSALR